MTERQLESENMSEILNEATLRAIGKAGPEFSHSLAYIETFCLNCVRHLQSIYKQTHMNTGILDVQLRSALQFNVRSNESMIFGGEINADPFQ